MPLTTYTIGRLVAEKNLSDRMLPLKAQLANAFHETHSFKWDPATGFTLASGLKSPFYVDCRSLMAHPESRRLVAQLAYESLRRSNSTVLADWKSERFPLRPASRTLRSWPSRTRTWRTFVVRKQAKDHGLGKLIEGSFQPGDRAVIVDDVLTSGGSLLKAVAAAREAGLTVTHALVIVDRKEQDGRRKVEAEGLTLVSLLTIDDLTRAQPTHP